MFPCVMEKGVAELPRRDSTGERPSSSSNSPSAYAVVVRQPRGYDAGHDL
ncbi:hypothetical protein XCCB100_3621 [Xanthomonas campestris pv. campestris]|uniref:Uncharacterized protein n=1 Tax=Xanthomonas campestris pv. campestris (strain B100) TaxID=509169 RepID=B0RV95_XANCB|nr:hypothetical protein XCCB100_3621 [Xanthomonas campestris pv. campestris]